MIKILASTAQGRVWLKTGKNGSIGIFAKFKAGRDPHAIGSALNAALAVDITGDTLMSIVVNDAKAVTFINGSYSTGQFDLWGDLCRVPFCRMTLFRPVVRLCLAPCKRTGASSSSQAARGLPLHVQGPLPSRVPP